MWEFLGEYGLFLAKAVTIVVAVLVLLGAFVSMGVRGGRGREGHVEVKCLSEDLRARNQGLLEAVLEPAAYKQELKRWKKEEKQRHKELEKTQKAQVESGEHADSDGEQDAPQTARSFVLDFDGDIRAAAVSELREAITAVLGVAEAGDEVILRLESPGGVVHGYGLAASQLARIRDANIRLVVVVDKVAASGGYMMACVADEIIAAPFAILGSIGVVAQIPNFHRLLKKNDIDFELLTAGEYKRTLTVFGENTDKGRAKFIDDLEDTHALFKEFVSEQRPAVEIDKVATGEIWFGRRALEVGLVDALKTSDQLLLERCRNREVFQIKWHERKSIQEKLGMAAANAMDRVLLRWWQRLTLERYL